MISRRALGFLPADGEQVLWIDEMDGSRVPRVPHGGPPARDRVAKDRQAPGHPDPRVLGVDVDILWDVINNKLAAVETAVTTLLREGVANA
jgi:hypothetical protein